MKQPVQLVPAPTEDTSAEPKIDRQTVSLDVGQSFAIEIRRSDSGVTLDAHGSLTMTITMEAQGPRVELQNASLTIGATDELVLEAEHLKLKGHDSCSVETGGDVELKADGEMRLTSQRDCIVRSEVIHLN